MLFCIFCFPDFCYHFFKLLTFSDHHAHGAWLSSRTASSYSGLELIARQWTDQYSLQAGGLIQLSSATLSLVCQLDASSPLVAHMTSPILWFFQISQTIGHLYAYMQQLKYKPFIGSLKPDAASATWWLTVSFSWWLQVKQVRPVSEVVQVRVRQVWQRAGHEPRHGVVRRRKPPLHSAAIILMIIVTIRRIRACHNMAIATQARKQPQHQKQYRQKVVVKVFWDKVVSSLPSVLWCCWLGGRKGIQPVKNWVVGCWHGYLSGARCRLAYGPDDATATHCLLLQ